MLGVPCLAYFAPFHLCSMGMKSGSLLVQLRMSHLSGCHLGMTEVFYGQDFRTSKIESYPHVLKQISTFRCKASFPRGPVKLRVPPDEGIWGLV